MTAESKLTIVAGIAVVVLCVVGIFAVTIGYELLFKLAELISHAR